MNLILTGATGFLGSHLLRALVHEGHCITLIKRSHSNLWRISDIINENLNNIQLLDIDREPVEKCFDTKEIDAVIHAATSYSSNHYNSLVESNLLFPLKILDLMRFHNVRLFINTDTFFSKHLEYNYLRAYSLSKSQFAAWGKLNTEAWECTFINMVLEHVYGPQDNTSKFVDHIIRSCLSNSTELNLTPGEQKRDFIYVEDVVSAYLRVLKTTHKPDFYTYSVGTGYAISIKTFVEIVKRLTNAKTQLNFGVLPYRHQEIMYSCADPGLLGRLGWKSHYSLEQGLQCTINQLYTG